jgi:hypothetical protein
LACFRLLDEDGLIRLEVHPLLNGRADNPRQLARVNRFKLPGFVAVEPMPVRGFGRGGLELEALRLIRCYGEPYKWMSP